MQNLPIIKIVIPTRLHSTRLPGKPLMHSQKGTPHIVNLLNCLITWMNNENCYVATDSELIQFVISEAGFQSIFTPHASNGTERVAMAVCNSEGLQADWILNIQGDLVCVNDVIGKQILNGICAADEAGANYVTFASSEEYSKESLGDQSSVWVAVDPANQIALDFGRAPITARRDNLRYHSHIGIYAYKAEVLSRYLLMAESDREKSLLLEQMRFVDNGIYPFISYLNETPIEINTEQDQIKRLRMGL
jgi:3-deoxy-manno-octulosonate cytidylyltransferase (CMP-KDO synthetase)